MNEKLLHEDLEYRLILIIYFVIFYGGGVSVIFEACHPIHCNKNGCFN